MVESGEGKEGGKADQMEWQSVQTAAQWAVMNYGAVMLADRRRTARAVNIAQALASNPGESLPTQLGSHAASKAAYRFLQSPQVSYERLMRPHLEQTQALMRAQQPRRVVLIQDTTEIDYQHHPTTSGLGPVGQGNHHGYLLQTVLAVEPQSQQVLGIAAQEPFLRQPAPAGESSQQRAKRAHKESEVWQRQVQRMGAAPQGGEYIHVGDRGSDIFAFLRACQEQGCGFLVRVQHDRRVDLRVDQAERPVPSAARRHGSQRAATQEPVRHLAGGGEKLAGEGPAGGGAGWQSEAQEARGAALCELGNAALVAARWRSRQRRATDGGDGAQKLGTLPARRGRSAGMAAADLGGRRKRGAGVGAGRLVSEALDGGRLPPVPQNRLSHRSAPGADL